MDLLKSCVPEEEVKAIASIPILSRESPDCLVWPFEKSRALTVRFAYGFLSSTKSLTKTQKNSSSFVIEEKTWNISGQLIAHKRIKVLCGEHVLISWLLFQILRKEELCSAIAVTFVVRKRL